MISDREIALLSNQLVFFIAIIVKGFQGPSVFLDSLVFETGFSGSPSLLDTKCKLLAFVTLSLYNQPNLPKFIHN